MYKFGPTKGNIDKRFPKHSGASFWDRAKVSQKDAGVLFWEGRPFGPSHRLPSHKDVPSKKDVP